jgi:hypothetical protein
MRPACFGWRPRPVPPIPFGEQTVMAKPSDIVLRSAPSVASLRARLARARDTSALITLYGDANSRCRGGSGDDKETGVSCAECTEVAERLDRLEAVMDLRAGNDQAAGHECPQTVPL